MAKHRITISLSDSTVQKVDRLVDKKHIRNRSHAIEHLIENSLTPSIQTAVILAGERTSTQSVRALTEIDGKPLIFYTLELLQEYGIKKVYILTNTQGKAIEDKVGAGQQWAMSVYYRYEETPLGTAGAVASLRDVLPDEPFFILAGDVLITISLEDMVTFHNQHAGIVTMAVKPRPALEAYDSVYLQGSTVVNFKKSTQEQMVGIVNTGVYLVEHRIFSYIPSTTPATLEDDVFPKLVSDKQLNAFTFQGLWFDVTSDQNYSQAVKKL